MKRTIIFALLLLIIFCFTSKINAQWIPAQSYIPDTVLSFVKLDTKLLAGVIGGVYFSTDDGLTWNSNASDTAFGGTTVYSLALNNGKLFAGTDVLGIFISADTGKTWTKMGGGLFGISVYSLGVKGSSVYAATDYGIFVFTENGLTWKKTDTLLSQTGVYSLVLSGDSILAGTNNGLFVSSNGGTDWKEFSSGFPGGRITSIIKSGWIITIGTFNGVYSYNPENNVWNPMNNGISNLHVFTLVAQDTNMFVGTDNGMFYSTDQGDSWKEADDGFTFPYVYALIISGGNIVAGTWGSGAGVWTRSISKLITAINIEKVGRAGKFSLEQNYPNPFNPSTVIQYSINKSSNVTIKIYNVLGKEVSVLVNKYQPAGSYKVQFNSGNLPTGVYFYTLRSGNSVQTRKLIILK